MRGEQVNIIGFCGHSGSGKTTLIEKLVPLLAKRGFKTGYLKHDAHRLVVDREGKDTDRLFKAGAAAVAASSMDETFSRSNAGMELDKRSFFGDCDIVIAEGYKNAPWDKIWVHPHSGGNDRPAELENIVAEIGTLSNMGHGDTGEIALFIETWLASRIAQRPLFGGLLAGGESKRMGSPKSLLRFGTGTLAEKQYSLLQKTCDGVYILGSGPLPRSLGDAERISDPPGISGPLAGMVAAHRLIPDADWLFLAIDLPNMDSDYLNRLKTGRRPARRFIGPEKEGKPEPLCAVYSPHLLSSVERSRGEELSITRILVKLGITGDPALFDERALKNINTPGDLLELRNAG